MTRYALLFALVAATIAAVWYWAGRPVALPASPLAEGQRLTCLSYAPFHGEQAPFTPHLAISDAQIAGDLEQLTKVTSCIRTYSSGGPQGRVTRLAGHYGLKVMQGIWIGRSAAKNRREIEYALRLARLHPEIVTAIIVGNETLLRGELGAPRIQKYLKEVQSRTEAPVTYADVWEFWLKAPELAEAADFITIHILPYWEDDPVAASEAVDHVSAIRKHVAGIFPEKEIVIGEVGWPSAGRMRGGALPSPANQALVLSGVVAAAKEGGWKVNLIEAYNQPWKRLLEGTVGGYWGMFDDQKREPKFQFGAPVSNHPQWRLEAGLGILIAAFVFVAGWFGAQTRKHAGERAEGTFAVALIALTSGLVAGWAAVNLPMESPESGDRLRAVGIFVLAVLVPAVAAFSVARGEPLDGFAVALNPEIARRRDWPEIVMAMLLALTVIAAIHVALGLVFDPRYKDFPLAALSGPVAALAVVAFSYAKRITIIAGVAEGAVAATLASCAIFIVFNESAANWQALWLALLLALLALTALRARPVPS